MHPGQRVLILGTPGTEKTLLFRALAGLWPWGTGTVRRPRGETIHFMPRGTPYLPRGTLAEVLSYAMEPSRYPREAMVAALASMGLQRLAPLLETTGRWERELSMDEQLRLGFARVVLQAPPWLVMDEAFGAFDDDTLELIIDVLTAKLAHTGIVHIGSAGEAHDRLFTRVVRLVKVPDPVPEELAA
jgi:putative ATP-binding cassette transporter